MSTTTLLSTNKPVKLNVGGTVFTTLLNTLTSEPDTFFVTFFSDYFAKEMIDDCYFIDRDPKYFNLILNHLRGNNIVKKTESLNDNDLYFVEEVHYYQIESIMKILPKKGIIILKQMGVELLDKIYENKFCCFTKCGENAELLNENKRIKQTIFALPNCGAIGEINCHHYKIKIISLDNRYPDLLIGFASQSKFKISDLPYYNRFKFGWFLSDKGCVDLGITKCKNIKFRSGTIIEVKYNSKKESISYILDGKNYGVVFDNVKDTGDICPAFVIHCPCEFEFIDL